LCFVYEYHYRDKVVGVFVPRFRAPLRCARYGADFAFVKCLLPLEQAKRNTAEFRVYLVS
jgi:hypothetical protein